MTNLFRRDQSSRPNQENGTVVIENSSITTFTWGGRFHKVPEGFRFPGSNVRTLWEMWFVGIPLQRIGPLKGLTGKSLANKRDHTLLSKAKFVLKQLIEASGVTESELIGMTIQQRDAIFETSFVQLYRDLNPDTTLNTMDQSNIGNISYVTLYYLLKSA